MAIITTVSQAKCKHCKFSKSYHPLKNDGTESKLKRTRCSNPNTQINQITMNDLVCDKWDLY
ncbi:hypothetical protein PANI_CDS0053 [Maribacter phage Panino]